MATDLRVGCRDSVVALLGSQVQQRYHNLWLEFEMFLLLTGVLILDGVTGVVKKLQSLNDYCVSCD